MSRRAVGRALGVSETTVLGWESGRVTTASSYERDLRLLYDAAISGCGVPEIIHQHRLERWEFRHRLQRAGLPASRQGTLERVMRALGFIRAYEEEHGVPPSYTEIGRDIGVGAPAAKRYVQTLLAVGYLARDDSTLRPAGPMVVGGYRSA